MKKTVGLIHSVFVMVDPLKKLFSEIMPEVRLINIVDDSILPEVINNGKITKNIIRRVCNYITILDKQGVDIILSVCTTMSEVMDVGKLMVDTPILKIDEPMAEKALSIGNSFGVVATFQPTLEPSVSFLYKKAAEVNKQVNVKSIFCHGAFDELLDGNKDKHDRIVTEYVNKNSNEVDVIILAQGSMAEIQTLLSNKINKPVLASPELAVRRIKNILS